MDVLIAHFDTPSVDGLRRMLEPRGYLCHAATRAIGLERAISSRRYGVLLLDWDAPTTSPLVAKLRRTGRLIPVLGLGSSEHEASALDEGADDFIEKRSLDAAVLVARVAALHRRSMFPSAPRRVQGNGIVIDEAARSVTVNGKPVRFASTEVRILCILVAAMGKIVSRREIITGCWGEVEVSTSAIESIIKRIRQKLGAEGESLRSVRLRGYILIAEDP